MSKDIYLFSTSTHPEAISINSLDIKLLHPDIQFSNYDYLIITSKQSVAALKQYANKDYLAIPALCISKQSAISFEEIGGVVADMGSGYGDNLVSNIKKQDKSRKWLYLRAKEIASSFTQDLKKEHYQIDEAIVYESHCSNDMTKVEPKKGSILIFTSPSSIRCFLKYRSVDKESNVVVIGDTTALELPKNIKYHVAKEKNIASCIDIAKSL